MANIEKIVLPDNTEYEVHDANAYPKTGGFDNPITGGVKIQKDGSSSYIEFHTESGYNSMKHINRLNDVNNEVGGLSFDYHNGTPITEIYAANGSIDFNVKGQGVSTNRVYIENSGQIVGALKYYNASNWTDTTMTAYTWVSKCGIALPVGRYIVTGIVQVKGESSTSGSKMVVNIGVGQGSSDPRTDGFSVGLNHPSGNNSSTCFSLPLNLPSASTVYIWGDSQVSNIHWTGAVLYAIRIN